MAFRFRPVFIVCTGIHFDGVKVGELVIFGMRKYTRNKST